jgi:hypothetical protein
MLYSVTTVFGVLNFNMLLYESLSQVLAAIFQLAHSSGGSRTTILRFFRSFNFHKLISPRYNSDRTGTMAVVYVKLKERQNLDQDTPLPTCTVVCR